MVYFDKYKYENNDFENVAFFCSCLYNMELLVNLSPLYNFYTENKKLIDKIPNLEIRQKQKQMIFWKK